MKEPGMISNPEFDITTHSALQAMFDAPAGRRWRKSWITLMTITVSG